MRPFSRAGQYEAVRGSVSKEKSAALHGTFWKHVSASLAAKGGSLGAG